MRIRYTSTYFLLLCTIATLGLTSTSAARAATLADSVADFSGVQGQSNWYYGYYNKTADGGATASYNPNTDFQLMTQYGTGSFASLGVGPTWQVNSSTVFTSLWASGGHGNGLVTSGSSQHVEEFAIRRWVSMYTGSVTISGHIAKIDNSSGGNGVAGDILVNGTTIFGRYISSTDTIGSDYSINLNLVAGDQVEFWLDPWMADDRGDASAFTGQITTNAVAAPECSTFVLVLTVALFIVALNRFNYARRLSSIN